MANHRNPPCTETPDAKAIGARIRALRRARGWNTGELARRVEFSVSACDAWQYGYRIPNLVALLRMAVVFRRKIDFLVRGSYAKPGGPGASGASEMAGPAVQDRSAPAVNDPPFLGAPDDGSGAQCVMGAELWEQHPCGLQVAPADGDEASPASGPVAVPPATWGIE